MKQENRVNNDAPPYTLQMAVVELLKQHTVVGPAVPTDALILSSTDICRIAKEAGIACTPAAVLTILNEMGYPPHFINPFNRTFGFYWVLVEK